MFKDYEVQLIKRLEWSETVTVIAKDEKEAFEKARELTHEHKHGSGSTLFNDDDYPDWDEILVEKVRFIGRHEFKEGEELPDVEGQKKLFEENDEAT